jgi:hypothetical protein
VSIKHYLPVDACSIELFLLEACTVTLLSENAWSTKTRLRSFRYIQLTTLPTAPTVTMPFIVVAIDIHARKSGLKVFRWVEWNLFTHIFL